MEEKAADPEHNPGDTHDLPDGVEVPDYDPADWVVPPQGSDKGVGEPSNHGGGVSGEGKGEGEGEVACVDGES